MWCLKCLHSLSSLLSMALCVVRSVNDICVRRCGSCQASRGPRKLNPISVLFCIYLRMNMQCNLSRQGLPLYGMYKPAHELHFKLAGCVALLHVVCRYGTALTLRALCDVSPPSSCYAFVMGWCSSWSLRQSHVRFMLPPDVSWLYKMR